MPEFVVGRKNKTKPAKQKIKHRRKYQFQYALCWFWEVLMVGAGVVMLILSDLVDLLGIVGIVFCVVATIYGGIIIFTSVRRLREGKPVYLAVKRG